MRPKKPETTRSGDLFRARLDQIINLKHELAQLAGKIDWDFLDGEIAPLYSDKGRPGIPTRFAIGLLLLKQIYGLSDEGVCERWVYDPYFQFFTGEEFFQHEFPHERSDLSHWRKRPQPPGQQARGAAAAILPPCRQARGDDGGALCPRQTVQPPPSRNCASCARVWAG
jgi:transposase, IS5 family